MAANAELDYDSWVRIGMALKGALGEAWGRYLCGWSAQAAKDVPAATDQSLGQLQTRSHWRRHDLPPCHGARLAS
jgi:hypothetical protein